MTYNFTYNTYNKIKYNVLKLKTNFKIRKKKTNGRFFNGKIVNFSCGRNYNKLFFVKVFFLNQLLNSPFSIRNKFIRKFKVSINKLIGGGCIETSIPILVNKPIGYLFYKTNNNNFINTLFYFSYGSKNSWVKCINNNGYIASSLGTYCLTLFSNFKKYILILPSGLLGLFDKLTITHKYININDRNTNYYNNFKKNLIRGKKQTVRGIAKNPNDHPHGGRTKTVLKPMTPWGKTILKKNNKKIIKKFY